MARFTRIAFAGVLLGLTVSGAATAQQIYPGHVPNSYTYGGDGYGGGYYQPAPRQDYGYEQRLWQQQQYQRQLQQQQYQRQLQQQEYQRQVQEQQQRAWARQQREAQRQAEFQRYNNPYRAPQAAPYGRPYTPLNPYFGPGSRQAETRPDGGGME
jgi:hypothetical protein